MCVCVSVCACVLTKRSVYGVTDMGANGYTGRLPARPILDWYLCMRACVCVCQAGITNNANTESGAAGTLHTHTDTCKPLSDLTDKLNKQDSQRRQSQ